MEKILLTGASGFLGRHIMAELSDNYNISSLGRQSNAHYICDLSTSVPVFDGAYDTVIHAAGKAHDLNPMPVDENGHYTVNVNGTKHLCEGFDNSGSYPAHFVFISSVAVYGLEHGELVSENQPVNGKTAYAKSKIQAEAFLSEWCSKHNVNLTILRLPLLVGANPPGNLGAMINAIKRNRYFTIQEGATRKSMVLASDVAMWIPNIYTIGGTYHLTDGYHPDFAELAAIISKALDKNPPMSIPRWLALPLAFAGNYMGKEAPLNCIKLRKIISTLTFDDTRARTKFGWNPRPVLEHFKIQ